MHTMEDVNNRIDDLEISVAEELSAEREGRSKASPSRC